MSHCPCSKLIPKDPDTPHVDGCKQWCEFAVTDEVRKDEFQCLFWMMKGQLDEIIERLKLIQERL